MRLILVALVVDLAAVLVDPTVAVPVDPSPLIILSFSFLSKSKCFALINVATRGDR